MNLAHALHTEWLTEQLRDSENKLAEAQNTISETKQNIAYLKKMLKLVSSDNSEAQVENNVAVALDDSSDNKTIDSDKRTAKQMLLSEYADMSLSDAIYAFLAKIGVETSVDDIVQEVFDVQTEDEFQRVKSSISTELRRNQDSGRWQKAGRGCWQVVTNEEGISPNSDAPILEAIEKASINGATKSTEVMLAAPWT
jgi:hypothetical protein